MNLCKKICLITFLFILTGCSLFNNTAKDSVEEFLGEYQNLSTSVLDDLETVVQSEDISDDQKEIYRDILKKQYSDLTYEIVDETYNGDNAIVNVKIKVYDLYKAQDEASKYLNENMDEFLDDKKNFNEEKYMDYKLDKMKKMNDKIEYTIEFVCVKDEKNNWKVSELETTDLEKIHGIYNYNG